MRKQFGWALKIWAAASLGAVMTLCGIAGAQQTPSNAPSAPATAPKKATGATGPSGGASSGSGSKRCVGGCDEERDGAHALVTRRRTNGAMRLG